MAQQQRRSFKNVVLTKKYHVPYMGTSIFISMSLLLILYGLIMYRFAELYRAGDNVPIQVIGIGGTLIAGLIGVGIIVVNVLAAHRIAGVHIKLRNVCSQITDGDFSARLRFRKGDQLEEVEESFNTMMDVLEERLGGAEAESAPTDESDEASDGGDS